MEVDKNGNVIVIKSDNEITENQQQRLTNIDYAVGSIALVGAILGVIYSKRTGGGFWRGVGYWVAGGLIIALPAKLISVPFKNKIIKESK